MKIIDAVKSLIDNADFETVRALTQIVVDAYSSHHGQQYELVPVNKAQTLAKQQTGGAGAAKGGVKRSKRWSRIIESCDYTKVPTGYAIRGSWGNTFDLSKNGDKTLVMVSVPGLGIVVGHVKTGVSYEFKWRDGSPGEIKHLDMMGVFAEGDYAGVVGMCKDLGVPQSAAAAAA